MTRTEAIEAMKNGQRVTHQWFEDFEFIYKVPSEPNMIYTEDGYCQTEREFWNYRQAKQWQTGWELFKDKPENVHDNVTGI